MVLMFSGESLLTLLSAIYHWAFNLLNVPLFTVSGAGISLFHVFVFGVAMRIVIELLVITFGGSPGEVEVYYDDEDDD